MNILFGIFAIVMLGAVAAVSGLFVYYIGVEVLELPRRCRQLWRWFVPASHRPLTEREESALFTLDVIARNMLQHLQEARENKCKLQRDRARLCVRLRKEINWASMFSYLQHAKESADQDYWRGYRV